MHHIQMVRKVRPRLDLDRISRTNLRQHANKPSVSDHTRAARGHAILMGAYSCTFMSFRTVHFFPRHGWTVLTSLFTGGNTCYIFRMPVSGSNSQVFYWPYSHRLALRGDWYSCHSVAVTVIGICSSPLLSLSLTYLGIFRFTCSVLYYFRFLVSYEHPAISNELSFTFFPHHGWTVNFHTGINFIYLF